MDVLYQAMRGLSTRQRVIADNIANIQTPGFQAGRVDFESSLRRAIGGGDPNATSVDVAKSGDPSRQDGRLNQDRGPSLIARGWLSLRLHRVCN